MKKLLLLTLIALTNTTIWAQHTPFKTGKGAPIKQTKTPEPMLAPKYSGAPTIARPIEGKLTIQTIDNFGRSPLELPKGLTATNVQNGLPRWIEGVLPAEFKATKTTETRAFQYILALEKSMKIENSAEEFEITRVETDEIGQTHVRMRQKLGNVPVYGSAVIVHEIGGLAQRFNGAYFPTPSVKNLKPMLSTTTAEATVQAALVAASKPFNTFTAEQKQHIGGEQLRSSLVIYHKNDDPTAERLAYHVIAYPNVLHRYEYFVDAENGAILDSFHASCSVAGHAHDESESCIQNEDLKFEPHSNLEKSTLNAPNFTEKGIYTEGSSLLIFYRFDHFKKFFFSGFFVNLAFFDDPKTAIVFDNIHRF